MMQNETNSSCEPSQILAVAEGILGQASEQTATPYAAAQALGIALGLLCTRSHLDLETVRAIVGRVTSCQWKTPRRPFQRED